jgi:hypothetical protein
LDGSERHDDGLPAQPPRTLRLAIWNSSADRTPSS